MRLILTVAALAALSCPAAFAADAAAGKAVYEKSCKTCHGADGTPSAGMAKAMNIKDFKTTDFSDADIKAAVTNGKGKMPPYKGKLTDAQITGLVGYIRTLQK